MSTENNPLNDLFSVLEGILISELPTLIEKGETAIIGLFHKHSDAISALVTPPNDNPCPQGYIKDEHGVCVPNVG